MVDPSGESEFEKSRVESSSGGAAGGWKQAAIV